MLQVDWAKNCSANKYIHQCSWTARNLRPSSLPQQLTKHLTKLYLSLAEADAATGCPWLSPRPVAAGHGMAVGILGPYLFGCGLKTFAMLSLFIFQQLWSIMMGLIADFTTK